MLAIAVNTFYATWRKRGTRRQLMNGVVVCVVCALLLFAALFWYNTRFVLQQGLLSLPEVEVALTYVALLGWFLPLSVSASFCLFASDRVLTTSVEIPRQQRRTKENPLNVLRPPRYQKGMVIPFVYDQDTPWCWLEYRSGRLLGQRIAFKRAIITLGREEDNDVWLDDEQASRHHAEIAWDKGEVYLTDCDSMNGVLLNGQRIRSATLIESGAMLEICSYRFHFTLAERDQYSADNFDPLSQHVWHSTRESLTEKNVGLMSPPLATPSLMPPSLTSSAPITPSPEYDMRTPYAQPYESPLPATSDISNEPFYRRTDEGTPSANAAGPGMADMPTMQKNISRDSQSINTTGTPHTLGVSRMLSSPNLSLPQAATLHMSDSQPTAPLGKVASSISSEGGGMLFFRAGETVGKMCLLDRSLLTIGRGNECDIVVYDIAASRQHALFVRQADGNYVQDLSSQNGTFVNEELLTKPHLLRSGDMIRIGNIRLEYLLLRAGQAMPRSAVLAPRSTGGSGQFKMPGISHPGL